MGAYRHDCGGPVFPLSRYQAQDGADAARPHRFRYSYRQYSVPRRNADWRLRRRVGAQLPLLRGEERHLSAADFSRYRSDDRLFGPHIESEADDDRCSGAARYFRCIRRVARFRIYGGRGRCDRHHRRCRRPHSHLPFEPARSGHDGFHRHSGLFLHGPRAGTPAVDNEVVHNQKGASYPDAAAQAHLQERENHVPDNRSSAHLFPRSLRSAPARHALSGKPVEGERRYQTSCHDGRGDRSSIS